LEFLQLNKHGLQPALLTFYCKVNCLWWRCE